MIEIISLDTGQVIFATDAPSLKGADFRGKNLHYANFADRDIRGADFRGARLGHADLSGCVLDPFFFRGANLDLAILRELTILEGTLLGVGIKNADLRGATFEKVGLRNVNFGRSRLKGVNFRKAIFDTVHFLASEFSQADFEGASFRHVTFSECQTLSSAKGLETIQHNASSSLDVATLRSCVTTLPDAFLRGVGYTATEVADLRAMYGKGIELYSCFLSYARKDSAFANRLYADLIQAGVSCWQDVHDLKGGQFWREQIRDHIRLRDKVVVVCSEESLVRTNVVEEIVLGIEDERRSGGLKLFPIRLDDFVLSKGAEELASSLPSSLRREDWLGYLRNFHVPDFSEWDSHAKYKAAFDALLRDLKGKG